MKKLSVLCLLAVGSLLLIVACSQEKKNGETKLSLLEPVLPDQPYQYANIQRPDYIQPDRMQIDDRTATLGRVLFYDKMLSLNNSIACASCHIQQYAFSDGQKLSRGITPAKTSRNSLAIINADRENGYFWDLRETSLESMVLKPIQNHIEMGFDKMDNVVANIKQTPYYSKLFTDAFGTAEVTDIKIGRALAQFIASMKSHNSKYDIGKQSNFSNFTTQELVGMDLMTTKLYCKNCHAAPDFNGPWQTAANIGLDLEYTDNGVGALANLQQPAGPIVANGSFQNGYFKIPSLRNIELTAPYMHDGRFKTLEEVVEHYNSGVKNHPNLDWNLKFTFDEKTGAQVGNGEPLKLNLSSQEKASLVAFLKTLTDYNYTNNIIYSDPFRVKD
jgi:cytochrome c peroxidase